MVDAIEPAPEPEEVTSGLDTSDPRICILLAKTTGLDGGPPDAYWLARAVEAARTRPDLVPALDACARQDPHAGRRADEALGARGGPPPLRRVRGTDLDRLAALRATWKRFVAVSPARLMQLRRTEPRERFEAVAYNLGTLRPAQLRRCLLGLPVSARAAGKILAAVGRP